MNNIHYIISSEKQKSSILTVSGLMLEYFYDL